jgi:glycosyltransferase involved in cell wall biosynthesis
LSNKKLINYIERFGKPDLLICHFSFPTGNRAKKLSKKYNIPYVIVEHSTGFFTNLYNKYQLTIIKKSLNSASFIFPVSNFLKNKIRLLTNNPNIKVIGNIVDNNFFFKKKKKNNKKTKFIVIAQLVKKKNIYNLLKVFKDIRHKYDFELSIVGKGPEEKKLKQYVLLNRLDKNIKFYGSLTSEKISKLLDLHHFLVSCSKVETFGISIAEAMAKGIPAIIMNSGGPKDFSKNFNAFSC